MTRILLIGMLPPESHNPEERRFVQELRCRVLEVRYLRGIGVKSLKLRHLLALPARLRARGGASASFKVGTLAVIPVRGASTHALNVAWIRSQLYRATAGRPGDWVLWTRFPSPEVVDALENVPFAEIVYEPIDRYAAAGDFSARESSRIIDAEEKLAQMTTVIAGSRSVADSFRAARGGSHWLPFGSDLTSGSEGPGLAAALPRPRIGVVAELDWRMDEVLMEALVREHPGWTFVLVGPRRGGWGSRLGPFANVQWLGRIEPERVRPVVRDCDVTLIPYRLTAWTRACLPVKVYEYLAEGKPVIATLLPELDLFSDVVTTAPAREFGAAIEAALRDDSPALQERRREAARRYTLQDRATRAIELLQERMPQAAAR